VVIVSPTKPNRESVLRSRNRWILRFERIWDPDQYTQVYTTRRYKYNTDETRLLDRPESRGGMLQVPSYGRPTRRRSEGLKAYPVSARRHSCTDGEHHITVWPSIQLPIGFRGIPAEFLSPPAIKEYLRDFCGNKKKERKKKKREGGGEMRGDRSRHACTPRGGHPVDHLDISSFSTRPFENNRAQCLGSSSVLIYYTCRYIYIYIYIYIHIYIHIYSAARKMRSNKRF